MTLQARPSRLPVLVLTGFLGSGKTSLLNGLLERWPRSAVLINEFGALPVDQRLVERHGISVSVLGGGCLCCQMRGTLIPTLKNLWMAWNAGHGFERLIIESSGVASPEPVLDSLLKERWLAPRLQLQSVVTTLAVPAGLEQLDRFPEAMAQVIWADALVLTQADLADAAGLAALEARLAQIAPATPRLRAAFGRLEAADLPGPVGIRRVPSGAALPAHSFHSFSVGLDAPVAWEGLRQVLEAALQREGSRLLRIKGVVYLPDEPGPVAVHASGGRLHPPTPLARRAAEDGKGRLVFITEGESEGLAERVQAELGGLVSTRITPR